MAYCEYDEGYLVFNRSDGYKEVWRRRRDVLGIPEDAWPSEPHNKPDENMLEAWLIAETQYLKVNRTRDPDHLRGQFAPWARLLVPGGDDDGLTFKLTRGTLLVFSANRAFLYDIEKAELEQTIEAQLHGNVQYVDVSEEHVFFVSPFELAVYDRMSGSRVLVIPSGRLPWDFYASPRNQWRRTEDTFCHSELGFLRALPQNWAHREDYFDAGTRTIVRSAVIDLLISRQVHVSSCGKHLAIMAMSNRVILVQDFQRLIGPSQTMLKDISKQIDFYIERPSLPTNTETYLAYDRGKVAIFGAHGIFILVLDSILDKLEEIKLPPKDISLRDLEKSSEHEGSWPNLRLRKVEFDNRVVSGTGITPCLQLTETRLYFSVISEDPPNGDNMWCYDFGSGRPLE